MDDKGDLLRKAMEEVGTLNVERGVQVYGGKRYLEVVHRVDAMRRAFGTDLRIETEILQDDEKTITMRAVVSLSGEVLGIGHAKERYGEGKIRAKVEVCETSSIGRALSACGLGGGEYASATEMARVVDKDPRAFSPEEDKPKPLPPKPEPEKPVKPDHYNRCLTWLETCSAQEAVDHFPHIDSWDITPPQKAELAVRLLTRGQQWDAAQGMLDVLEGKYKRMKKELHGQLSLKLQAARKYHEETVAQAEEAFDPPA